MKIFRRLLFILTLCGLTGVSVLQAETCTDITIPPSNPTYLLSASNDGTVTDTRSGLMWKQCAEGFIWSGNTCNATGNIGTPMSWSAALQLAASTSFPPTLLPFPYADWRLPNIKELSTLVELCRSNSAINDSVFPNTQNGLFWSSSPSLDSPGVAWMVNFADGSVNNDYRASSNLVRLVRGGGGYANFDLGHTQTLTFGPAPTLLLGGSGTVSATGGACPPVIFTSLAPAICTSTASGLVTGKALGTCIIAANQAACGVYTAAPQVTQSFPVAAVPLYMLNVAASGVPIPNVLIQASPTLYGGTTPYNKSGIASGTVITLTAPPPGRRKRRICRLERLSRSFRPWDLYLYHNPQCHHQYRGQLQNYSNHYLRPSANGTAARWHGHRQRKSLLGLAGDVHQPDDGYLYS